MLQVRLNSENTLHLPHFVFKPRGSLFDAVLSCNVMSSLKENVCLQLLGKCVFAWLSVSDGNVIKVIYQVERGKGIHRCCSPAVFSLCWVLKTPYCSKYSIYSPEYTKLTKSYVNFMFTGCDCIWYEGQMLVTSESTQNKKQNFSLRITNGLE